MHSSTRGPSRMDDGTEPTGPWGPYEHLITGNGESVATLLALRPVSVQVNAPLALIQCSVRAQVGLLRRLAEAGLLRQPGE